ncbi:MAG: hypothetical protein PHW31_04290 [Candidatus Pacebacteria bacterium]|nr:hypothetical protein [Candidatus Paceibacterota bacterium]
MSKKIILIIIVIIILAGAGYFLSQPKTETEKLPVKTEKNVPDPKNCAYILEGKSITLKDGYSEEEIATGSASKSITQYFGNEATGDFNNDGFEDIVFLLTQSNGGSGTFFYAVVAFGLSDGYQGTNAIFLGDRIAPQTTEFRNGEIIVNYAQRKPDESMTAAPSLGVSKYFQVSENNLIEIQK